MRLALSCVLPAIMVAGCVSKSGAHRREMEAFQKGQQQAVTAQQQTQAPVVWFRGLIRNSRVPWSEGLTLAQGILAAQYTGASNPSSVRVTRQGQVHLIDLKLLLRGEEDPLLEPGDLVEVLR